MTYKKENACEYNLIQTRDDIKTDKKNNTLYWDCIEAETEAYIKKMANLGGIDLFVISDVSFIKKMQDKVISALEKEFPEIEFPFVEEDL